MKRSLTYFFVLILSLNVCACSSNDDGDLTNGDPIDCSTTTSIFAIHLDPQQCQTDIESQLNTTSIYTESMANGMRTITINGVANHRVGNFPNSGNPNAIAVISETYTVTTHPQPAAFTTSGQGYTTAVLFSGAVVEPYTAEFFIGTNGINTNWNIATLQSETSLGLDCNNAHVQPTGRYHYHGTPSAYVDDLAIDGTQMVKVGLAADGYPIYYKYGYGSDGTTLVAHESGYRLKTEERGGDGFSAPDGCPDGYYFQDYEYVDGVSSLDACNGRIGKTPESDSEYYYVITDNFPSMPLCFTGTPDASFSHMP